MSISFSFPVCYQLLGDFKSDILFNCGSSETALIQSRCRNIQHKIKEIFNKVFGFVGGLFGARLWKR